MYVCLYVRYGVPIESLVRVFRRCGSYLGQGSGCVRLGKFQQTRDGTQSPQSPHGVVLDASIALFLLPTAFSLSTEYTVALTTTSSGMICAVYVYVCMGSNQIGARFEENHPPVLLYVMGLAMEQFK